MGKSLKILSSYKTTIALLFVYALSLAIATFIERVFSTSVAKTVIYYSPILFIVYFLLIANFVCTTLKHRLLQRKKYGFMIVHTSLLIILAGAFVSHVSGKEGSIHIREGETLSCMIEETGNGNRMHELPFRIKLDEFKVMRYPGSSSPSSFESSVTIYTANEHYSKKISMNNVLDIKGYRLFQASYDEDEKGSTLIVNKDVAGRNITYTGYTLLIIGFILAVFGKHTRFDSLKKHLRKLEKGAAFSLLAVLLIFCPYPVYAGSGIKPQVDMGHASLFGSLPMQSIDGRIEPVNTFSSEILRKLHKSQQINGLSSDQFLLSLICLPEMWMHIPVIALNNKDIIFQHDLTKGYCAYTEFFDTNGNYKLANDLNKAYQKSPSQRTSFDKDLIKLDEQVNILHQLINGQLINIFPKENDPNHKWYAPGDELLSFPKEDSLFIVNTMREYTGSVRDAIKNGNWEISTNILKRILNYQEEKSSDLEISTLKIRAELLYNKLGIFSSCKKAYLISGAILLILSFVVSVRSRKWLKWIEYLLTTFICITLLYHLCGIGMRWYIAEYAPWSNSYETMVYVAFITVLAGLFFIRQSKIPFALATLFGGVILFVAGLNWMNPQISPLVPVLKSPWLMIHVAVIVAAYGFFGIGFLLGLTNLIFLRMNKSTGKSIYNLHIRRLSVINEMCLWIGLVLMTTGTFIGAIWANESWGRYWGWDPKETWALITIIIYTIVTHLHLIKKWNTVYRFNLLSVFAFFCVLMTYFGVNYLLSGMHSYA